MLASLATPPATRPAGSARTSRVAHNRAAAAADGEARGVARAARLSSPVDPLDLSSRRTLLLASAGLLALPRPASAIQGLTAGRIPGLAANPGPDGTYLYTRPEGKSGGHGVGWSVIPKYMFNVPTGWEETPVSIADLGGTEIDLRYGSKAQGSLVVICAPVARFVDVERNADVRITELATGPDVVIDAFATELFGAPLNPGDVLETDVSVDKGSGLTYYRWTLQKPHRLVAATAVGNRLFFLAISASGIQWRRAEADLRAISASFRVDPFKL